MPQDVADCLYAVLMFVTASTVQEQCFIADPRSLGVEIKHSTDRFQLRSTLLAARTAQVSKRVTAVQSVLDQLRAIYAGPAELLQEIGAGSNWPQTTNNASSPGCFDADMQDLQTLQHMVALMYEANRTGNSQPADPQPPGVRFVAPRDCLGRDHCPPREFRHEGTATAQEVKAALQSYISANLL